MKTPDLVLDNLYELPMKERCEVMHTALRNLVEECENRGAGVDAEDIANFLRAASDKPL